MNDNAILNNRINETFDPERVIKETALLYLHEAVIKQRYEDCAELVQAAKAFGALQSDITIVLIQGALGIEVVTKEEAIADPANRLEAFEI